MIIESFVTFMNKIMLFSSYVDNVSHFPKPLSPEEEKEQIEKFRQGDEEAKKILVSHNLRDGIVRDIKGADLCIDIHASNIFLREIPQVRINEKTEKLLVPLAKLLNMDYIWVHGAATVLESTLAYSLNDVGTPTLVVEMGVGMRITQSYGDQLITGILSVMSHLGMLTGPAPAVKQPVVSTDGSVSFINADASGFFMPRVSHGEYVKKGQLVGFIADSLNGTTKEELFSPVDGMVFTLREYPVVNEGSLIARILGGIGA